MKVITVKCLNDNSKVREAAYKSLLTKYQDNKGVIGQIYQNIVLNWKNEGRKIERFTISLETHLVLSEKEYKNSFKVI